MRLSGQRELPILSCFVLERCCPWYSEQGCRQSAEYCCFKRLKAELVYGGMIPVDVQKAVKEFETALQDRVMVETKLKECC
ncbi:hypothetical protein CMV_008870 [Castanea mollissima]|uniref:Uncharacterized protein n=1 Tax=Castanea mollissima TaxID=60419 RepID=A0A8J4RL47_9ROSI|nr:hypothetical protein CMV_008870 [Castanea mollissima]